MKVLGGPKGTLSTGQVSVQAAPLFCLSDGSGKENRTAAWCSSRTTEDLSCRMVQAGYADPVGAVRRQAGLSPAARPHGTMRNGAGARRSGLGLCRE